MFSGLWPKVSNKSLNCFLLENQDSLNRSESTDSGRSSSSPSSDRRAFHSNLNDEYSAAVANKTGTKEKTPSKKGENPRSENEGRGNLNSDKTRYTVKFV